jgi:membrane fusion protein (multidrug efflux system)
LQDEIDALKKGVEAKRASLQKAKEAYEISVLNMKRIEELEKNIESLEEKKEALKKGILEIENKISYSVLYAPFDGIIAKKFIARDRVVKKGSPVYALVDPKSLYCEVLLSEKKLHGVKVGNRVKITVDALKDKETEGVVESIAPTSASTFSLVPRDIASGEFTKLDQRFKVRIALKDKSSLRVGMSAEVAIERK